MKPVIALVGRPNVGKSTLFNRLTRSRDALVANLPGLTRDRQYGEGYWEENPYILIDTGGISGDEDGIDAEMASQSLKAVDEADVVLFLVDGRAGLTATDQTLANHLRQQQKQVDVIVNKIDGLDPDVAMSDFYGLGLGDVYGISASHGRGVRSLMDKVFSDWAPWGDGEEELAKGVKIGVVGRPNVGKSTLVNRLLGEDRVVVFDQPGTTRDSIYINYERNGEPYTIIDTAGVRRRKKVSETVEKFSIVKTLQAITDANVVVLVVDAHEGLVEQDLHLLGYVIDAGRALVIAINKWDGLDHYQRQRVKHELERRLRFIDYAKIHFISALHGSGVGNLYGSVTEAHKSANERVQSNKLTRILEDAVDDHQPPLVNGRRIKLRYAHMGGSNPPLLVIHGNQTDKVPNHYVRYLEKVFRRQLKLVGTPLKIEFKTSDNPFAGRKNKLTERQINKRQRMVSHYNKGKTTGKGKTKKR